MRRQWEKIISEYNSSFRFSYTAKVIPRFSVPIKHRIRASLTEGGLLSFMAKKNGKINQLHAKNYIIMLIIYHLKI